MFSLFFPIVLGATIADPLPPYWIARQWLAGVLVLDGRAYVGDDAFWFSRACRVEGLPMAEVVPED